MAAGEDSVVVVEAVDGAVAVGTMDVAEVEAAAEVVEMKITSRVWTYRIPPGNSRTKNMINLVGMADL